MSLSGDTVRAALSAVSAVGKQMRSFDELAAGANGALVQAPAGLTPDGAASFLATLAQESDYFRTTREYGSGQRYAPYIGRGFCQVTWESNYRLFGAWCKARGLVTDGDVFAKNPGSLEDYRWSWLTGVWYFAANNLWGYANRGDHYSVSQGVNRGVGAIGSKKAPLHWDKRKAMFDSFRRAGAALLPGGAAAAPAAPSGGEARPSLSEGATGDLVAAVQRWLNASFPAYSRIDLGPRRYGPQTVAVVREFQRRVGITGPDADGTVIGPRTWQKMAELGFRA